MNLTNVHWWLLNGEVGISSKTMASALLDVYYHKADMPYDADDFRRCYKFAEFAELQEKDFNKIIYMYPWWQHIRDVWVDCAVALSDGCNDRVLEILSSDSAHGAIMREHRHMVKVREGFWVHESLASKYINKETETPSE